MQIFVVNNTIFKLEFNYEIRAIHDKVPVITGCYIKVFGRVVMALL